MLCEVRPVKFSLSKGNSSGAGIATPDAYGIFKKTGDCPFEWLTDYLTDSVDRLKASVAMLNEGSLSICELMTKHEADEINYERYVGILITNGLAENDIVGAVKKVVELVEQADVELPDGYRRLIDDMAQAGDSVIDLPDDIADVLSTACEFALDEDHIVEMPDEYARQQVAFQVIARYVEAFQQSATASQSL